MSFTAEAVDLNPGNLPNSIAGATYVYLTPDYVSLSGVGPSTPDLADHFGMKGELRRVDTGSNPDATWKGVNGFMTGLSADGEIISAEEWAYSSAVDLVRLIDGNKLTRMTQFATGEAVFTECRQPWQRADGRWVVYYVYGHVAQRRTVAAMLSDTTDPFGTYTAQGDVLVGATADTQKYHVTVGDDGTAHVYRFIQSTESIVIDLYSVDSTGLVFTLLESDYIVPPGAGGTGLVTASNVLNGVFYYRQTADLHNDPEPRSWEMFRATIDGFTSDEDWTVPVDFSQNGDWALFTPIASGVVRRRSFARR